MKVQPLEETPLITRTFILVIILFKVLNYLSSNSVYEYLRLNLIVNDKNVMDWINYLQIFKIFTAWLVEPSILITYFSIVNLIVVMTLFEIKNSSIVLFVQLIANLLTQSLIMFVLELILFSYNFIAVPFTLSYTMIWLNLLFKFCHYNSENTIKVCFVDKSIPLKHYTYIMLGLVCFVSMEIRVDAILGVMIGVIECLWLEGGFVNLKMKVYENVERLAEMIKIDQFECWQASDLNRMEKNSNGSIKCIQFYENLYEYSKEKIPYEEPHERTSTYFKGEGVQIY